MNAQSLRQGDRRPSGKPQTLPSSPAVPLRAAGRLWCGGLIQRSAESPTRPPNRQSCRPSSYLSRSLVAPTPPLSARRPCLGHRNQNARPKPRLRHGAPPCPPSATARRKGGWMRRTLTILAVTTRVCWSESYRKRKLPQRLFMERSLASYSLHKMARPPDHRNAHNSSAYASSSSHTKLSGFPGSHVWLCSHTSKIPPSV